MASTSEKTSGTSGSLPTDLPETPVSEFAKNNPTVTPSPTRSRTSQREIGDYILRCLLLSDEQIDKLQENYGIGTPIRSLLRVKNETLNLLVQNNVINLGEKDTILDFQEWYKREKINHLLYDLDDWKRAFNMNTLDEYDFHKEEEKSVVSYTTKNDVTDTSNINVKLSEYPKWDGKHNTWKFFYNKFKATASLAQLDDLLIMDGDDVATDPYWIKQAKNLYNILVICTSNGLADTMVTKYEDTKNGVHAWQNLYKVYELGGDHTSYVSDNLKDLGTLELHKHSFGGMEKYIADFETLVKNVRKTDKNVLSDIVMLSYFTTGIKDEDYTSTIDICAGKSYEVHLTKLRQKAKALGRLGVKPITRRLSQQKEELAKQQEEDLERQEQVLQKEQ